MSEASELMAKWERIIKNAPPVVGPRGGDVYENNVGRVGAALNQVLSELGDEYNEIFLRRLAETAIRALVGTGAPNHE